MKLTIDQVMSYGPCYKAEKIEALFAGREAITLHDIAEMDIPDKDKVWLFCQKEVLSVGAMGKWLETIVPRAIKTALAVYNEPSYVKWAENWLNGNDRSARAAAANTHAADAAARTAAAAVAVADAHVTAYAADVAVYASASASVAVAASTEYKQQVADLMELLDKED